MCFYLNHEYSCHSSFFFLEKFSNAYLDGPFGKVSCRTCMCIYRHIRGTHIRF